MTLKTTVIALSFAATLALTGCGSSSDDKTPATSFVQIKDLPAAEKAAKIKAALTAYADYALTSYTKAKADAVLLQTALTTFTATPTAANLTAAKDAWLASRESYGVTEILRLSCGPIDGTGECAEAPNAQHAAFLDAFGAPEGQLNAWPLDENMIDYTTDDTGAVTAGNIIDTAGNFTPTGGTQVDATTINKELIAALNENGGDANVATGYHAIEFLLWGQDQDYVSQTADNITHGATVAGQRPLTDYTTDANADRRKAYLNAAAELIIDDLDSMITAWTPGAGSYTEALVGEGSNALAQEDALKNIFSGMANFLGVELANERIEVARAAESEEDEHSCFSDNTHRDIDLNYIGFKDVLGDIFKDNLSTGLKTTIETKITSIDAKVKTINDVAKSTAHFDYQIVEANSPANYANITATVTEMKALASDMTDVAAEYGIALN